MDKSKIHKNYRDDWRTPDLLWSAVLRRFGDPVFDLAADPENARCPRYYTKEVSALENPWPQGLLFCNPPFSRKVEFIEAARNLTSFSDRSVIMILPVDTSAQWFHCLCDRARVYLLKGRVQFTHPEADDLRNPGATCVTYFSTTAVPGISLWDWKAEAV